MAFNVNDNDGYVTDDEPILLMTASTEYEAVGIESLLRSFGIPTLLKHRGTEGFTSLFTGTSTLGVDIFVPSKLLDKANEIINAEPVLDEEIESGAQEVPGNIKDSFSDNMDDGVLAKRLLVLLVLAIACLLLCLYFYYSA